MCRGCLRCVAWFSYWFDNLGFISEGNTYRHFAASSLPLWGNADVASSDIKRNFWRRCRGGSSTYTRFLIKNLISSQFILFSICLSFASPPLHKKCHFIRLSFSFAVFSSDLFFACVPCVFYLLASSLPKNILIWILIHLLIFSKDPIMVNQLLVN